VGGRWCVRASQNAGHEAAAATVAGGNMCMKRRESKEGKGDMNKSSRQRDETAKPAAVYPRGERCM